MDPNTLKLDPDPEFLAHFGSVSRVMVPYPFLEKNDQNNFRETPFSVKFNNTGNKIMKPQELLVSGVSEWLIYVLNDKSYIF